MSDVECQHGLASKKAWTTSSHWPSNFFVDGDCVKILVMMIPYIYHIEFFRQETWRQAFQRCWLARRPGFVTPSVVWASYGIISWSRGRTWSPAESGVDQLLRIVRSVVQRRDRTGSHRLASFGDAGRASRSTSILVKIIIFIIFLHLITTIIFVLWSWLRARLAADGNTLQILTTILTNIIDFSLWSIQRVSSILHKRGWGWNGNSEREASSSGDGRFRHHGGELDTMVVILKMVLWWWKNGKWKKLHRFAVGVKEVDDMAFLFTD